LVTIYWTSTKICVQAWCCLTVAMQQMRFGIGPSSTVFTGDDTL
jgi:hypothetical protein